jgi:hypothetical protein
MFATLGGLLLGLLIGLRHAFEPDHLAAVSTLVVETRDPRRGVMLGAMWGLGHTLALVAVGGALVVTGAVLPEPIATAFELVVAVMLVALGVRGIMRALRSARPGPVHAPAHGDRTHHHAGPPEHIHARGRTLALQPLVVGIIHGMAGSGAMTAMVFAELPTTATRVAYIALFGAGSIVGMALVSGIASASLGKVASSRLGRRWRRDFGVAIGALSVLVGVFWGCQAVIASLPA